VLPKSFPEIPETEREMIKGYKLLYRTTWLLMKKERIKKLTLRFIA
jgi:hypothetical protein